jgi:hypothetical protein
MQIKTIPAGGRLRFAVPNSSPIRKWVLGEIVGAAGGVGTLGAGTGSDMPMIVDEWFVEDALSEEPVCYIAKGQASRWCGAVTLVTLFDVTDAATMAKISFWRYLAVNRKTLFTALACALLVFSMLGCGTSNKLQSIQLSNSSTVESSGSLLLYGIGGTAQAYVWGNYSNGKSVLLHGDGVKYQISLTPNSSFSTIEFPYTDFGDPNADPAGTVQLSSSEAGLLTAVQPYLCTFENTATTGTTPAFASIGSYTLTATYGGFTTPPAYVGVASEAGITSPTNPDGLCTNPPTQ